MKSSCARFNYWYTVSELKCIILLFVQSIREANLPMFISSLEKVIPWMFALDQAVGCLFISSHLRNCILFIQESLSSFTRGFLQWVETNRLFSCISDYHAHEQNKKLIKSDGYVVGILNDTKALLKWIYQVRKSKTRVTSSKSTSYEFKSTSYEFQFTRYVFESTSYEFKSTSYELQFPSYELEFTSYEFKSTS